jgi:hypothetical protein
LIKNQLDTPNIRIFDFTALLVPEDNGGYLVERAQDNFSKGLKNI